MRDCDMSIDSLFQVAISGGSLKPSEDSLYIVQEPLGVVLVIGPWNYPLICVLPLLHAIAAGSIESRKKEIHVIHRKHCHCEAL